MRRESLLNAAILLAFVAVPLWAWVADEPFIITLTTRAAILALAGVGLNVALGLGGLVSLGHAAFFGSAAMPWACWPFMRRITSR